MAIPSYQQLPGVINSLNHGSTTLRNIPDVAMEGHGNDFLCTDKGCGRLAGTSFATPRWAGFMALVNEQAAQRGRPSVGFLTPLLYALGSSWSYTDSLHDIISGNNNNETASFDAVPHYDLVTGWGSPNGQAFIDFLTR